MYADFKNALLRNAKFGVATIANATFDGADLSKAEFIGANTIDTSFVGADLSDAQFYGARLTKANFEGALLAGTDLSKTSGLNHEMLRTAFGTTETRLPDGVQRPQTWINEEAAVEAWRNFRKSQE